MQLWEKFKFDTPVKKSRLLIYYDLHANWCPIWNYMGFRIFLKNIFGSFKIREIELSS